MPSAHSISATAQTFMLAIPSTSQRDDVYWMHQEVWAQVDRRIARDPRIDTDTRPSFLYRLQGAVATIRVTGRALARSSVARLEAEAGARILVKGQIALWRDAPQAGADFTSRALLLLREAGLDIESLDAPHRIARGIKRGAHQNGARATHEIILPVADCTVIATVRDAVALRDAWLSGIGRGRRFGFGMLDVERLK